MFAIAAADTYTGANTAQIFSIKIKGYEIISPIVSNQKESFLIFIGI